MEVGGDFSQQVVPLGLRNLTTAEAIATVTRPVAEAVADALARK